MFKVGIKDKNGELVWTSQIMDYFKLLECFPDAKYDITPHYVHNVSKKMCLPPGADPRKYMKFNIKFFTDDKSGRVYAKVMPNAEFKRWFEKKLTVAVTCSSPTMTSRAVTGAPVISNRTSQELQRTHLPSISIEPVVKPPLAIRSVQTPEQTPLSALDAAHHLLTNLEQMSPEMRREIVQYSRVDQEAEIWTPDFAATATLGQILQSPMARALYKRGYADAEAQHGQTSSAKWSQPSNLHRSQI